MSKDKVNPKKRWERENFGASLTNYFYSHMIASIVNENLARVNIMTANLANENLASGKFS